VDGDQHSTLQQETEHDGSVGWTVEGEWLVMRRHCHGVTVWEPSEGPRQRSIYVRNRTYDDALAQLIHHDPRR